MRGTIAYCSREDHVWPSFTACIGNDIAQSRNQAVVQMQGDWIWFIDTDMVFAPDTVARLLAHKVDAVQVHCLMRHPPHEPVLYTQSATKRDPVAVGRPRLVEVQTLGAGGTLYRKKCFELVSAPWFEGPIGVEDTTFAAKLRAAGVQMYVDLGMPVGHLTPMAVMPDYDADAGVWGIRYRAVNGESISFVPEQPKVLV